MPSPDCTTDREISDWLDRNAAFALRTLRDGKPKRATYLAQLCAAVRAAGRPTPPTADRDKRIGSGGVLNSQQSRSAVGDGGTSPASPPLSSPGRREPGREVHVVASEPLEISPAYARREV